MICGLKSLNGRGFDRTASRYATTTHERTNINGPGLSRSASVRNSPIDRDAGDHGAFGRPHSHHGAPPPQRHHSASPKLRPARETHDISSSESSSSEDENPLTMRPRPKAQPRPKLNTKGRAATSQTYSQDGPALTGQFPSTNYTRIIGESQYQYPPPSSRGGPIRQPFPNMISPDEPPHAYRSEYRQADGGNVEGPKYVPSFETSRSWSQTFGFHRSPKRGASIGGLPSWAVPSSVFPKPASAGRRRTLGTVYEDVPPIPSDRMHTSRDLCDYSPEQMKADLKDSPTEDITGTTAPMEDAITPQQTTTLTDDVNKPFSPTEWQGKFAKEAFLGPSEVSARKSTLENSSNEQQIKYTQPWSVS